MSPNSPWKKPNEVMQLHRLRKRKRVLQERMKQPQSQSSDDKSNNTNIELDFSRLSNADKRRNPFSKSKLPENKKLKTNDGAPLDESNDKTLFALLKSPSEHAKVAPAVNTDKLATFSNLLQKYTADHTTDTIPETKYKYLPIDWALKTRVRLMSSKPFAWNQKLKPSEEASGITGFVRCLDTTSSPTLDTSPRALFHQTCLYWQHPHLPWLTLYPRSRGKVAATSFLATNDEVKQSLYREWTDSFRSLFQLLRALHCPFFYVCGNTFTCLFRAAGIGGMSEPSALLTPTTRGFRQALRKENIEFIMPLKPDHKKKMNNSDNKDEDKPKNSSFDSCYDTMDESKTLNEVPKTEEKKQPENASGDEEDLDSDNFLSELGFDAEDIKRINNTQARVQMSAESSIDSAAESLVFVKGVETQALFNFLFNCKSIISTTGPFAGVPPTLLAPTAFHGGTLQPLKVRESSILVDSTKYHSVELRGPILPNTVHTLFRVLRSSVTAQVSGTFAQHQSTLAFSLAAKFIAEDERSNENESGQFTNVFNKENLSDCGFSNNMLQSFCSSDPNMVKCINSVKYTVEDDTYTW